MLLRAAKTGTPRKPLRARRMRLAVLLTPVVGRESKALSSLSESGIREVCERGAVARSRETARRSLERQRAAGVEWDGSAVSLTMRTGGESAREQT